MAPVESTAPETTSAIAASTLLVCSGTACEKRATVLPLAVQLVSTKPGCKIASLGEAWPVRAKTWLLLRMYWMGPRITSAPRVPEQQVIFPPDVLETFWFPHEVQSLMGKLCRA